MSAQPIQKAHFTVSFEGPNGSFKEQDNLEILAFPSLKQVVEVRDFVAFNSQIPYAGIKNRTSETATFRFFDTGKSYKFWSEWMKKVYDADNDTVGIISDYVGNGEVTIYKASGKAEEGMTEWGKIKIIDCWPSAIGIDSLEVASDEQLGYSVTLQIVDSSFEYA